MNLMRIVLVIANLVFSLITFGLIIMVYAARTNWHAAYEKAAKNVQVAQANAQTYATEADETKKKADAEVKKISDELTQTKTERDRWERQTKDHLAKLEQLDKINKSAGVSQTAVAEELNRRKNEIDQLAAQRTVLNQRLLELEKDKKDYRDRAVSAELGQKSEQDRNQNLLTQVEALNREITRLQSSGGGVAGRGTTERRPPPEDVEGLVLEIDPQTGYLTISIGSDAGLTRGNTLEVYRLKPGGKYLGTVQILEVRPDRAVAKPISGPGMRRGEIQVGDQVASNILSKR